MTKQIRLSEKDFASATLCLMFNNRRVKLIAGIVIAVCLFNLANSIRKAGALFATLFPVLIIASIYSIVLYFTIRTNYRKNSRAAELKNYTFQTDHLFITGESFTLLLKWTDVRKVSKSSKWILIFENNVIAYPLKTEQFSDAELQLLKNILSENNVKNNL